MKKEREYYLDILKILSIIGMVALHTQRSIETGICYNPIVYYGGRFCMPIFFMVNGSLILSKEEYTWKYVEKKLFNMFRLLMTWAVIDVVFYVFTTNKLDYFQIMKVFVKGILGYGTVPFWFFFTFAIIYLFLLLSFDWVKKNIRFFVCILATVCIVVDMCSLVSIAHGGYFLQSMVSQRFRLWTWLFYFVLGYLLKEHSLFIKKTRLFYSMSVITVVVILYQYYLCDIFLDKINSEFCYDNVFIILWAVVLFVTIKEMNISEMIVLIVENISRNSFGVFLMHAYFIKYLNLNNVVSTGIQSLIVWIGLVLVCYMFTYFFSKIPVLGGVVRY